MQKKNFYFIMSSAEGNAAIIESVQNIAVYALLGGIVLMSFLAILNKTGIRSYKTNSKGEKEDAFNTFMKGLLIGSIAGTAVSLYNWIRRDDIKYKKAINKAIKEEQFNQRLANLPQSVQEQIRQDFKR